VGAADYAIGHCYRQHLMLLDKFQYLAGDAGVGTNITTSYLPVAQFCYFCILGWHNADSDLSSLVQVRTVERNRGKWPAPQSLSSSLSQTLSEPILHYLIAPQRSLPLPPSTQHVQ
jgi:hypothetical protein